MERGSESDRDPVDDWLLTMPCRIGQILIERLSAHEISLCHREDAQRNDLAQQSVAEAAIELARFDDAGKYRALKTTPNLRHGWCLLLPTVEEVRRAINFFYPGRLAAWRAWSEGKLCPTALRETLNRQSGMYRVAAKITDEQTKVLVGNFCRSDDACLRTILWKRDSSGAPPSSFLPPEKFDPAFDQTGRGESAVPLFCQEACNLLMAEARGVVKTSAPK